MPKVWTGNFAQLYEFKNSTKRWAVKCFTRSAADLSLRYSELSRAIAASKLPYFVDFRLLADEILVNAKRYPVVRMQWVDGQTLDKYVEANLSHPQVLLGIAGGLLNMVRDMEERQLAHGDLQHGNIMITASGVMKLVDYDGMFVPAFAGKPAPEIGLPSYQHPRRRLADYGVGLDRFGLLVMCTALCALAVDRNLWYEFSTGENFLFTSNDFKDPNASTIFRRLSTFSDERVRKFTKLLKEACVANPLLTPFPSATTLQAGPRPQPWWVGLPSAAPVSKESEAHSSPRPLSRRIAEFRHVGAATLILIGILALASGEFLGGEGAAVMSVVGVLGYLLERITRYYSLPALLHQRELHSQLTQLHRDLDEQTVKKRAVEQQMLTLTQQEHQEKVQELRRRQDAHGSAYLSSIPISRLKDISGIGPYVLDNLQNAGIHNALQLKQRGAYNVQGVGTKRRGQILAMLSQWERAGSHNSPRALPLDVEARIASKYQAQRQVLGNQFGEMGRRIAAIGSDKSEAEWQLKQLHVPTFSQFLKNTL